MTDERRDLLAQIAVWYYEERLDQAEIARRVGRSRSMISRMLNEVREQGLIEIRVKYPQRRNTQLERVLVERFGLKAAWVVSRPESWKGEMQMRILGRAAADCLQRFIHDDVRIGVAWSRTLHYMVGEIAEQPVQGAQVIQISGSVFSDNPVFDGPELVRTLAQRLHGEHRYFPAPLVVRDAGLQQSLMQERTIAETLQLAASCDVAVLGIGNIESEYSSLHGSGLVDARTYDELVDRQVAGDIIARQFDADGVLLDVGFNDRVVGLEPAALRAIPTVIAVSSGPGKARSTLAAMRGRWFNVLVSDEQTVTELLALAGDSTQREAG